MALFIFGAGFTLAAAWALGAVALRRLPVPHEIRLGVGAAILSTLIFALLQAGAFHWAIVLASGVAALATARWSPRAAAGEKIRPGRVIAAVLAVYGVFYFVNAAAPETVADGITYHLGLVSEYTRTGVFPDRIAFYDLVPQGMEMLFAAAFAFGRHSAAKLVEFGFFLATVPLLYRVGARLGLPVLASTVAVIFYFCAPVAGITGASSYNDAGQVFFAVAAFYLILLWRESRAPRYLLAAGFLAGFCYAVKMPGLIVPAVAAVYLAARREWKAMALFVIGAAVAIAPWMARSVVLTGNPFAPLLNHLFPNPYFHIATERGLAADLRSLHGVPWWRVPWELAIGGKLSGTYGPLLLAAPLMLAGVRRRAGQALLVLAAVMAIPWFTNTGARFVMLSIPFVALGVGLGAVVLGRKVAWAAIAVQAVLCFPPVIAAYEPQYGFRLHEFPIAGALRIEPEHDYLRARLDEYKVVEMLRRSAPPGARILALMPVATAYTDRDVVVTWQSAESDRLLDTLRVAGLYQGYPLFEVRAEWPVRPLRAIRVRLPEANPNEWCIHEIELISGDHRLSPSRYWTMQAWPNEAEAPLALDRNLATRWRTWEPMREGMFLEVDVRTPQMLSAAAIRSHTPIFKVPVEFFGRTPEGEWVTLSSSPPVSEPPKEDMRLAATHAVRRAGYGYILAPEGADGNGPIGRAMVGREAEWGLERAGQAGYVHLFRIR